MSHARALTLATRRAGTRAACRARCVGLCLDALLQHWRRQLRAVSSQVPSRSAITRFAVSAAASSTIRDRSNRQNGAEARRDRDSSSVRPASPRHIT